MKRARGVRSNASNVVLSLKKSSPALVTSASPATIKSEPKPPRVETAAGMLILCAPSVSVFEISHPKRRTSLPLSFPF